jgi:hypothetical protein
LFGAKIDRAVSLLPPKMLNGHARQNGTSSFELAQDKILMISIVCCKAAWTWA